MLRFKSILIITIVILTLGIAWQLYRKLKDTEKIKIGETSLKPTKKIDTFNELVDVFRDGMRLKGFVSIRNFSSRDYTLNQLSLDCFSPETEKLIAEQTNIIQNDIVLKAKEATNIPLEYNVDIVNALSLFKESKVIPEDFTLITILSKPMEAFSQITMKNLKVKLKGFIEAEKLTISINEVINIYE